MNSLEKDLLDLIISTCRLPAPAPGERHPDTPLLGPESPLGIDSLDAVEIVVAVQKQYGVRIDAEQTARRVLGSLQTLASFIRENRPAAGTC